MLLIDSAGGEWFQSSILRTCCSVMNQASSYLLNQEKLPRCCLFRITLADELDIVASADYDSSTNHDLEDSNCSQIIPLLLLSVAFFMSQTWLLSDTHVLLFC